MILLHIQQEHSFLTYLSKYRQAEVGHFRGICPYDYLMYCSNFVFEEFLETRRHFGSGHLTMNGQGYSELWWPIKTCKNCYIMS